MTKKQLGWIRLALGSLATIGFFVICTVLMTYQNVITPEVSNLLNILFGALVAIISSVFNFYFGSSQGSEDKTEHLANRNGQ